MNVHAIIIDTGNDIKRTFDAVRDCSAISILSYKMVDNMKDYLGPNYGYHYLAETRAPEDEINDLIKDVESDYYLVIYSGETVKDIVATLEKYKSQAKLSMVKPEYGLNKLIVHSQTHLWLLGFQSQTIMEKIDIQSKNEEKEYLVLQNIKELYERTAAITESGSSNSDTQ